MANRRKPTDPTTPTEPSLLTPVCIYCDGNGHELRLMRQPPAGSGPGGPFAYTVLLTKKGDQFRKRAGLMLGEAQEVFLTFYTTFIAVAA